MPVCPARPARPAGGRQAGAGQEKAHTRTVKLKALRDSGFLIFPVYIYTT
ncbi:MAG: hypothetical protein KAW56_15800 [Candidatus Marinimicrobia bacterium]|nr:hypothetical protein [Candidatus Neomarinimicrobiota bacterium]MCK4448531.1 hypothetical protein [Candidatus Neomarinimicrobiota bacterium]